MKILVVEDEAKLARALARGLEQKGYTVDTLADGGEALERIMLHHEDCDLVVLDLMLPTVSGEAICKTIRENGITIPILVLTARNTTDTKVDLLRTGADDYLPKPFSFEELDARIQAILRRPQEAAPVSLHIRDIVLNPADRTVVRNGTEISLTLKEFALLEYFMRNPNRVINREELLNHLWDFNYTSFFSNALDVHIKNLRKKIDYEDDPSILETVRGIGYRLRE